MRGKGYRCVASQGRTQGGAGRAERRGARGEAGLGGQLGIAVVREERRKAEGTNRRGRRRRRVGKIDARAGRRREGQIDNCRRGGGGRRRAGHTDAEARGATLAYGTEDLVSVRRGSRRRRKGGRTTYERGRGGSGRRGRRDRRCPTRTLATRGREGRGAETTRQRTRREAQTGANGLEERIVAILTRQAIEGGTVVATEEVGPGHGPAHGDAIFIVGATNGLDGIRGPYPGTTGVEGIARTDGEVGLSGGEAGTGEGGGRAGHGEEAKGEAQGGAASIAGWCGVRRGGCTRRNGDSRDGEGSRARR